MKSSTSTIIFLYIFTKIPANEKQQTLYLKLLNYKAPNFEL